MPSNSTATLTKGLIMYRLFSNILKKTPRPVKEVFSNTGTVIAISIAGEITYHVAGSIVTSSQHIYQSIKDSALANKNQDPAEEYEEKNNCQQKI